MDVSKEDNLEKLKSMAYDFIATKEQAENNLRIVNNRIAELSQTQPQVDSPVPTEE